MERNAWLLNKEGLTGVLVPLGFHANEGATGIRRLYLEEMGLRSCYSFENRRKLFEIDSRFKFALIVASRRDPPQLSHVPSISTTKNGYLGERSEKRITLFSGNSLKKLVANTLVCLNCFHMKT